MVVQTYNFYYRVVLIISPQFDMNLYIAVIVICVRGTKIHTDTFDFFFIF